MGGSWEIMGESGKVLGTMWDHGRLVGIPGTVGNSGPGICGDHTGVVQGGSVTLASGPYPHLVLGWRGISVAVSRGHPWWFLASPMPFSRILVSISGVPDPGGSL